MFKASTDVKLKKISQNEIMEIVVAKMVGLELDISRIIS